MDDDQFALLAGMVVERQRVAGADGVALAAIQGLLQKHDEKADRIDDLEAENEQLCERHDALEQRQEAVEDRLASIDGGRVRSPEPADD